MEKEKGASIIITENEENKVWIKTSNNTGFIEYMSQGIIHQVENGQYDLFNLLAYTIGIVLKECPQSQAQLMSVVRDVKKEIDKFDGKSLKS